MREAEAAREMAWEQLHSGPWNSVLPIWRDAYSMAGLPVARFHCAGGQFSEAIRVLDMGLIMGGLALRKDLESAVEKASAMARNLRVSEGGGEGVAQAQCLLLPQQFKDAEALPVESLSRKIVAKRSALSLEDFLRDYFLSGSPVTISDCMAHWPARTKWNNMDYLKMVAGYRTVPVEVGKNYLCSEWKQELITFSQFLERIQSSDSSSDGPTYLAQHPLFDQACLTFHQGCSMMEVVGKKYVRLYPASISEDLYPHSESMLSNSSQVDLDNIDMNKFPKVRDLEFMDCILEEGGMLYIPPKWWHYVRSLTRSFSVSFWWSDCRGSPES
ncbi:Lysine-specific demethylase [Actinidia chinensis var. chinensis]|uniref:Lysine-specific demethylase n=1 Tax=Actinidia chinensis var. chinensis TaxID=1590841 RepID=A0A2R6PQN7_ACTCC|nr:Lysine-specific demethylase [Actinidia chinensis var. chinensis]